MPPEGPAGEKEGCRVFVGDPVSWALSAFLVLYLPGLLGVSSIYCMYIHCNVGVAP